MSGNDLVAYRIERFKIFRRYLPTDTVDCGRQDINTAMLLQIFLTLAIACAVRGGYLNDFDKPLNFHCTHTYESISAVQSTHSNHAEDRRFDLSCSPIFPDHAELGAGTCFWTNYVNSYDKLVQYTCPSNHYISGMDSVHNNHAEDRIWKFYCCSHQNVHLVDCQNSGWTNELDRDQNYHVPAGKVMKGVTSVHDNHAEDRRFEYEVCSIINNPEITVG